MTGTRGYRNYRGRTPKGKIVLAVVLVLVILASAAVIFVQQHIVYDETGRPWMDLPWLEEAPAEEEDPVDLDLTIQEPEGPEGPEDIYVFTLPAGVLTLESWMDASAASALTPDRACNAAAFTVKDSAGKVYFDSSAAVSGTVKIAEDTGAALAEMTGESSTFYTIARLSCFHDPKAANHDVEGMGLKNTGGYIFYDGNNSQWLDPAKPAARQYLCELAKEAAALGFDEILLTDVSYPTEGKLDKIAYGETPVSQNLLTFLEELRAALEPYSVALSIELPETVLTEGGDPDAGLTLADIAPQVDRIYAQTTPEQIERLSAAVAAANSAAVFVPELTAYTEAVSGSCLIY